LKQLRHVCPLLLLVALLLAGCNGGASSDVVTGTGSGTDGSTVASSPTPTPTPTPGLDLTDAEITALAARAYVYGEAPVIFAAKAYDQTHSTADEAVYAPLNALYIDTQTSTPDSALWVSPNVNVLYASAHLDLRAQPILLYTPAVHDRYYVWEELDAYTNAFAYIGSRATAGNEGTYAFVGPTTPPQTIAAIPNGVTLIQSPTDDLWVVGRFEVAPGDQTDLNTVIALVQANVMLPLDQFVTRNPNYVNPIIPKPAETVPALDTSGLSFYTRLNVALTADPPPPADAPFLAEVARLGIGPGMTTDFNALPANQQQALLGGAQIAQTLLAIGSVTSGTFYNGWSYNLGPNFGNWGTEYLLRAETARGGLGANINAEAVYPIRFLDDHREPLQPDRKYTITFPAGQLPSVIDPGFWSVTMYDLTNARLVANSINRYALGSQNTLTPNPDGSITLYLQRADPGGAMSANWLPTAATGTNPFYLIFRAYHPADAMYLPYTDPAYKLPPLVRVVP
jgi:hypothetical protein